jgi:predicted aspartyl protease
MFYRPFFTIGLLAGLAFTFPSQSKGADHPDLAPSVRDTIGTVPFDLLQGYCIVVHGSAGTLKDLNFFLDTGTSNSTFDSRIASKLNLRDVVPAALVVMGGRVQAESATLPSLEVGPMRLSSLHIVTADLTSFQKVLSVRIDAIIGMDVLGLRPFVIDYPARVIHFGASPALPFSLPLRLDQGLAVLDAEIDSRPVHLLLDTGASFVVLFKTDSQSDPGANATAVSTLVSSGAFERKQMRLRTLRVGPAEFRKESAMMAPNPKPSQIDFDGVMSPSALGISRLSVNLTEGVLEFSR